MRKIKVCALLLASATLIGCEGEKPEVEVVETTEVSGEADSTDNEENVLANDFIVGTDSEEPTENIKDTEISEEEAVAQYAENDGEDAETFTFVDVFGEQYETVLNKDAPRHEYDADKFVIDGRFVSYEDDQYYSRLGIDVARHQGEIDWDKVKAEGAEFAFIRIGYRGYGSAGTINLDQRFVENIEGAQRAGLDVGVYFFSQAINEDEALEEAEFVIENLEGYELQLPVVYDPESILDDEARTDNVSGEQFTRNTIAFCNSIKEKGYEPMVYSNMLWEAFEFDMGKLSDLPFWYADYEEKPQTPYDFQFWQYSNEGRIDGIGEAMDLDIQILRKN